MHNSGVSRREGANARLLFDNLHHQHVVPAKAGTHTPCPIILDAVAETFCADERRWLWVPAFAGTMKESGWASHLCEELSAVAQ